jgi:hypothetical protein
MQLSPRDKYDPDKYDRQGRFLTRNGTEIDILDFTTADIDVEEIAHALAMTCRYGGHCREFYSVAQHAVMVSNYLEGQGHTLDVVMAGLHHDDSEAYLGDIIRPLKSLLPMYKEIETRFEYTLAEYFGIQYPYPPAVHDADVRVFEQEVEDVKWHVPENPVIVPWSWQRAKAEYLRAHNALKVRLELETSKCEE